MKADNDLFRSASSIQDAKLFVGRLARRQGSYGAVSVVGRVADGGIDVISAPKRLFPRDGTVETHGVAHAGLAIGDWVEFDVARNQRPRAPEYKAVHLRPIPRYAVLPDGTEANYRAMLTVEGWRGDRRPGLWALRISDDRVLVVELESREDGALGIPRKSARQVNWWDYHENLVVAPPINGQDEEIYLCTSGDPSGAYDWSDETDYVAQVIRSLSDVNDPHLTDLISWLEMHHEEQTGRIFAGTIDHDAAQASLRSGELAERLRADRELMRSYLDAALQNEDVREAVAEWAREGNGVEAERLRSELTREIADERTRLTDELNDEIKRKKKEALGRVEAEAAALADQHLQALAAREREAEDKFSAKVRELGDRFNERKADLERDIGQQTNALEVAREATRTATSELEQVRAETDEARSRLRDVSVEVDRLLEIADRLTAPSNISGPTAMPAAGIVRQFPERPTVPAHEKGRAIAENLLLSEKGKEQLLRLTVLMLAGEVPLLTGPDVEDFLRIAEALLCPGRLVVVDADPTFISVDDLWSRPGGGAPTLVAAAAAAAPSGAVVVVIRGIERSGARFWLPTLSDMMRGGGLPRGLLICCTVADREHEEIAALPGVAPLINVEGAFVEGAFAVASTVLSPETLELTVLDPGASADDLSPANQIMPRLGFQPSLGQALRAARIFAAARALLGENGDAGRIAIELARLISGQAG